MPTTFEPARKWTVCLAVNLLLGIPGIVPIWLAWHFAANWPPAALGWAQREPTENDGMAPTAILTFLAVGLSAVIWWLVNDVVARVTRLRGAAFWAVSLLAVLIPTLVCITASFLPE
ncbi:hypothetical protein GCM10027589_17190 [Actinocorallia lasiicapitis]